MYKIQSRRLKAFRPRKEGRHVTSYSDWETKEKTNSLQRAKDVVKKRGARTLDEWRVVDGGGKKVNLS